MSYVALNAAILTGGIDPHYAAGLTTALAAEHVEIDLITGTDLASFNAIASPTTHLMPFYGTGQPGRRPLQKLLNCLRVYYRLARYAAAPSPRVFHILWNYKLAIFDRTLLMMYFKLLGKRIVLTVHNVNSAERDGRDSTINRFTLSTQYRLADHLFVHTEKMEQQLTASFGVPSRKITVIPFGIYDTIPQSSMTSLEARCRLGLAPSDRTLLFFGRIVGYKGLHYLVEALECLAAADSRYKLIIAGEPMKEADDYWATLRQRLGTFAGRDHCIQSIQFIPDDKIEIYFKAADALVLPYTHIFQSGVLFMAYSFGLPVIATDVGSFSRDVITGTTGYLCPPADVPGLARAIETYFASDLYGHPSESRASIRSLAHSGHSWDIVGARTKALYASLAT
jgi:glycosyltransferase involved in cell wall biosynthesis